MGRGMGGRSGRGRGVGGKEQRRFLLTIGGGRKERTEKVLAYHAQ